MMNFFRGSENLANALKDPRVKILILAAIFYIQIF